MTQLYVCKDAQYEQILLRSVLHHKPVIRRLGVTTPLISFSEFVVLMRIAKSKTLKVDLNDGQGERYILSLSLQTVVENLDAIYRYDENMLKIGIFERANIASIVSAFDASINYEGSTFWDLASVENILNQIVPDQQAIKKGIENLYRKRMYYYLLAYSLGENLNYNAPFAILKHINYQVASLLNYKMEDEEGEFKRFLINYLKNYHSLPINLRKIIYNAYCSWCNSEDPIKSPRPFNEI